MGSFGDVDWRAAVSEGERSALLGYDCGRGELGCVDWPKLHEDVDGGQNGEGKESETIKAETELHGPNESTLRRSDKEKGEPNFDPAYST